MTRVAPRAEPTSDEARVRPMLLAAAIASAAAIAALGVGPEARAPGPLGLPHQRASLTCGACHSSDRGAGAACVGCHGVHVSARPAHRALEANGALGCVTCHAAHGAEGVTFAGDHRFVAWGPAGAASGASPLDAPAGATVPLVRLASCVGCHRLDDSRDPIAACVRGESVACFDEHRAVGDPTSPSSAVCAKQHGVDRFVAWEAAREVAALPRATPSTPLAPWGWAGAAMGAGAIALAVFSRRARVTPRAPAPPAAPPARVRLPLIDPTTCLGCSACVDACPFDVLAIDRFVAVVARPSECCGVILCAQACPNESLRIADGEPIADRPRVSATLESLDAPGVFLAGDLTGLPLIRNAIDQGARVADAIASTLPGRARRGELDLVVVGAGPAGLSAMLRAKERGLRAACVEQGAFAASLRSFPRGKVVFDVAGSEPLDGPLWMREATKEELIAQWTRAVRAHALDIREQRRVTDLARDGDDLVVTATTHDGATEHLRAPRVLLALGKRGTPRTLPIAIAPGAEGKVSYALADARSFAGHHVLVVGLGDTAMEAAIALAHQREATVTVSYRGADFARGKARNVAEVRSLMARGRVRVVFRSTLAGVDARTATLRVAGQNERIPNDAVLVLIGGVPSWDLVTRAGVRLMGPAHDARGAPA